MTVTERFESRLQQEYECRLRDHILALLRTCESGWDSTAQLQEIDPV